MKKVMTFLALIAVVGLFAAAPQNVEARAQYGKAFPEKYENLKEKYNEMKCGTCHGGEKGANKKIRSDYAKAFAKALGEKNVRDVEKINEAFDKAAEAKNGDEGTYGDLLKAGKLPPPAKAE